MMIVQLSQSVLLHTPSIVHSLNTSSCSKKARIDHQKTTIPTPSRPIHSPPIHKSNTKKKVSKAKHRVPATPKYQ
ncbi:uncharacterized protein BDW43DRAFT_295547 [Aspergillus alliaceus]|uniref:uncharacterized protein n=1 Tax=Petromyces alliaceus TaxID=209559 RepID=UPI0012A599FF|nr:uncharacterized protein BDW43DRAFT_295547 [Aspergillus alliaceus]KAB8226855.1 hypothetical protein BDW43DRAFT_295547 [Aspergillus alliaceus]